MSPLSLYCVYGFKLVSSNIALGVATLVIETSSTECGYCEIQYANVSNDRLMNTVADHWDDCQDSLITA